MSLSTHVLDAVSGRPVAGLQICLERRGGDGSWAVITREHTGDDGRLTLPLTGAGVHRLTFTTAAQSSFYPEVGVVFAVTDQREHYHLPLLISPFAYSTYRGS